MKAWGSVSAFLSDVRKAPFFAHVGRKYVSMSLPLHARSAFVPDRLSAPAMRTTAETVARPTVEFAVRAYLSDQWTDFRHEAGNLLGEAVQRHSARKYNTEWNAVMSSATSSVARISRDKACALPALRDAADDISWDLAHACCEIHFRDLVPCGLFTLISVGYVAGLLPFAWSGDFPQGSLMLCADRDSRVPLLVEEETRPNGVGSVRTSPQRGKSAKTSGPKKKGAAKRK